jgi:acyl-CoA thioesterase FadM
VILNPGFESPKTAEFTVKYHRPLRTPSAVLCRGWVEKVDGRKIWAKATLQGEDSELIAQGEALHIQSYAEPRL